jgi:hypothetical protein
MPEPEDESVPPETALAETAPAETVPVSPASADPTGQVFVAADDAAPETPEDDEPRPSALRTATAVGARLILGFVTLGVIAVVIAAAVFIRFPTVSARPASRVVTPTATAQQAVCPGGLLRLGSTTGLNATSASALGAPEVTSGSPTGGVRASDFAVSDAGTGHSSAAPRLLSKAAAASGSAPALLSGAQSEQLATPEFTGLAAAACTAASGETWLVGGSTSVGRTTLLLLANPTDVTATVSVQVYGEVGKVTAPGMDGILVSPDSQRVLSIAGFAPNVVSPVVHVTSTGGQVAATLEQTTVRGLTPGGVDFVGGASRPTTSTVIPGVVISSSSALQADLGQTGYDDLQTTLRLFLPGTGSTEATVSVLAEDGSATGKPTTAKLSGGQVTDLQLDSLSDGNYTVVVTSKLPLLASVRVSAAGSGSDASSGSGSGSGTGSSTDFAWTTAAPELSSSALVSVAPGMNPLLHLENPTSTAETVRVAGLGAVSQTITVAARSATSVTVSPGTTYELSGFARLYASVSGTALSAAAGSGAGAGGAGTSDAGGAGVTSYVVSPPARGDASVRVYG